MVDETWQLQLKIVTWFTEIFGNLLQWGGGCDCHQEQLQMGIEVDCAEKGRRLRTAYEHAKCVIDAALREANEWVADDWQGQVGLWQSLQGCVRGAHALSMRKIRFLCDVPYLLARLAEPGIKDRCVAQFAAVPMAHHHRVSREFLEPGHVSGLFPLVHAINPEASNIDPRLQSEITSLARIPLDDSVGESPHAKAKAIAQRAAGCDFPWVSATMRVRQNIADIRTIAPTLESFDLQEIWGRSSSVIQDSRHLDRAKRIKHE